VDLVAVRLPTTDKAPCLDDRILVVAPRQATRLLITTGDGVTHAPLPLSDGVGVVPVPVPVPALTIRALDSVGRALAELRYHEPDAIGQFFGEPLIENW
jgi:hypothetical protein